MKIRSLASVLLLGVSSAALGAQDKVDLKAASDLTNLVLLVVMLVFVGGFILLIRRAGTLKQGGYMARASQHLDQSVEYMKRMEQKTDRMIELLESIEGHLGRDRP